MPYFHVFLWDGVNDRHVAAHHVSTEEFEYVVSHSKNVHTSQASGHPIVFGDTAAGRRLACVYEVVDDIYCYPITAFDVE